MLRAAQRAREIARQTNTPLAPVRDGGLVEEYVSDAVRAIKKLPLALERCFTSIWLKHLPIEPIISVF